MVADVPLGAFLSGGVDSSTIVALMQAQSSIPVRTFTIGFQESGYDEAEYAREVARHLGTEHQVVHATHADIGRVFPEVIWHTEVPVMRTAPAPMFLLSKLVRDSGYKVVLTGEGADEFLGGYDIFKEAKIRRFWARQPDSAWRPLLFQRLYQDIPGVANSSPAFLAAFFKEHLADVNAPWYSHYIRWRNNRRACRFLSNPPARHAPDHTPAFLEQVPIPQDFHNWGPLERAQYLEITTFLSGYLLSSQGDRPAMAHSVEGRFPFLDCRLVEFCSRLPAHLKIRGLTEKYLLKECAKQWLPDAIRRRRAIPEPVRTRVQRPSSGLSPHAHHHLRLRLRRPRHRRLPRRRRKPRRLRRCRPGQGRPPEPRRGPDPRAGSRRVDPP
jgi:asparagine synthase (glutamine-hydrolysing)